MERAEQALGMKSHPGEESPRPAVEPQAEMSIEIPKFSGEAPFGPPSPQSLSACRVRAFDDRKPRHQEGRRGCQPCSTSAMTPLHGPGEHETPIVGEIDRAIRRGDVHDDPTDTDHPGRG